MAYHWIPPLGSKLKINVHGTFSDLVRPSANDSGIGAIYRNAEGELKLLTVGTIPFLTQLGNQLWAIFIALLRAFFEGYRDVELETDNYEAYLILKNFHLGAPTCVFDLASQIDIRVKDIRWRCKIAFVYPARNKVARYLARLGLEVADRLYTFNRPIGGVEELINWDMGYGIDHPDFQDVFLPAEAMDPVDFGVGAELTDQIKDLGLGQINAPEVVNLDVLLNADVMQEGIGIEEDFFHGGVIFHEGLAEFNGDNPLYGVD